MIWTRADLEVEQVEIESSDITAVTMRLPQCIVLLMSVYVQGSDSDALELAIQNIKQAVSEVKQRNTATEIIVAGDFNRHDILWGGNTASEERQGEAEPIIEMMGEQGLTSLLECGTITRDQGGDESTIDLVLTTQGLVRTKVFCKLHDIKHGSDHFAIELSFDLTLPNRP